MLDLPSCHELSELAGKWIVTAKFGKDDNGYDFVSLLFSDGSVFRVMEEGQAGWFKVQFVPNSKGE